MARYGRIQFSDSMALGMSIARFFRALLDIGLSFTAFIAQIVSHGCTIIRGELLGF